MTQGFKDKKGNFRPTNGSKGSVSEKDLNQTEFNIVDTNGKIRKTAYGQEGLIRLRKELYTKKGFKKYGNNATVDS